MLGNIYAQRKTKRMNRTGKREKNERELALWPNQNAKERGEKEKTERKGELIKGKEGLERIATQSEGCIYISAWNPAYAKFPLRTRMVVPRTAPVPISGDFPSLAMG